MKILNLYCGIGGNRKFWTPKGENHEITAVENNPKIAKIPSVYINTINYINSAVHFQLNH